MYAARMVRPGGIRGEGCDSKAAALSAGRVGHNGTHGSEIFDPERWRSVEGFSFTDITYHRAVDSGTVRVDVQCRQSAGVGHSLLRGYRS